MKKRLTILIFATMFSICLTGCANYEDNPVSKSIRDLTGQGIQENENDKTHTPTPIINVNTPTPSFTNTPAITEQPTLTPELQVTATPQITGSVTATPTVEVKISSTPTPTPTKIINATNTPIPTSTPTIKPTNTPTPTPTPADLENGTNNTTAKTFNPSSLVMEESKASALKEEYKNFYSVIKNDKNGNIFINNSEALGITGFNTDDIPIIDLSDIVIDTNVNYYHVGAGTSSNYYSYFKTKSTVNKFDIDISLLRGYNYFKKESIFTDIEAFNAGNPDTKQTKTVSLEYSMEQDGAPFEYAEVDSKEYEKVHSADYYYYGRKKIENGEVEYELMNNEVVRNYTITNVDSTYYNENIILNCINEDKIKTEYSKYKSSIIIPSCVKKEFDMKPIPDVMINNDHYVIMYFKDYATAFVVNDNNTKNYVYIKDEESYLYFTRTDVDYIVCEGVTDLYNNFYSINNELFTDQLGVYNKMANLYLPNSLNYLHTRCFDMFGYNYEIGYNKQIEERTGEFQSLKDTNLLFYNINTHKQDKETIIYNNLFLTNTNVINLDVNNYKNIDLFALTDPYCAIKQLNFRDDVIHYCDTHECVYYNIDFSYTGLKTVKGKLDDEAFEMPTSFFMLKKSNYFNGDFATIKANFDWSIFDYNYKILDYLYDHNIDTTYIPLLIEHACLNNLGPNADPISLPHSTYNLGTPDVEISGGIDYDDGPAAVTIFVDRCVFFDQYDVTIKYTVK